MQNRIYYSRDAEMMAQRNRLLVALFAALVGGSIGAIMALLFAEQRGEEVRGHLADQSESTFRRVRDGVEHFAKDVQKTVEHAR